MKKFLILIFAATAFVSCSDIEGVTYNDSQAYVAFSEPVYNVRVPLDSSISLEAEIVASNKVDYDRTYQLTLLESETDANPATYVIPSTVTIPANSYVGVVTITGTDNGLVDSNVKKLTLTIGGYAENESTDLDKVVFNIFEFCPVVVDEFVGDFLSVTWWNDGESVQVISEGSAPNTLVIEGFYSEDFVITYDPLNNNNVTFDEMYTGVTIAQGEIWATLGDAESYIDACTGNITLSINYYIKGTTLGWGDQNEVWTKL